ncbi:pyridoxal kinase [Plasmopara halstedii]|uniref:pyridoxal kinase n=1 Tax=Plasmopara halstedii TaxID=4781 RepID=A0A0P1B626_PLAHL|nr:pyridoxal kinase [Plasmopara halstedii]CEG49527.1 pyridoxal kinase [Plasmopara halstedii]|eukprot:XP_024585896.1 pyridoxal kinase [Plasmopara halstedii]
MVDDGRVLSIQSHVVQGYVGNKSAVFPLQILGFDVDPINSVQFSNHTGYATFTGRRLTGDELHELLDEAIVRVYERLRAAQTQSEHLVYVCDPVMGDLGKLYVPQELVDLYRLKVLPICDVLTPNQYECELLTEMKLQTVEEAMFACKKLHSLGPKVVVISSFHEAFENAMPKNLIVIGSKVVANNGKHFCEQFEIRFPWIDSYYTGTGDLFAALLLAWLYRFPNDFKRALENVISTIQDVLQITLNLGGKNCDLKLIQSRNVIAHPTVRFMAKPLAVPILFVFVDLNVLLTTSSDGQVIDVPANASIQRFELLYALLSLVGSENVTIVTNNTIPSAKALVDHFVSSDTRLKNISIKDIQEALFFNANESRKCETVIVTDSTNIIEQSSCSLFQVVSATASDIAVVTYIKKHNERCLLAYPLRSK